MNWKDVLRAGITAVCLTVPVPLASVAVAEPLPKGAEQESEHMLGHYSQSLPLGQPSLTESRSSATVAPGVTHTVIVRGERSDRDAYTVDVAFLATPEAAIAVAQSLRSQGYQPRVKPILKRAPDDPLALNLLKTTEPSTNHSRRKQISSIHGSVVLSGFFVPLTRSARNSSPCRFFCLRGRGC